MTGSSHDVRQAVEHVASKPDPKARAEALFDTVHGQIRADIEQAKGKGSVADAVRVFEHTLDQYAQHRDHIIGRLAGA